jgi:type IV pilus assembly protein PilC
MYLNILTPKLSTKRMYFICQQLSFALESGMSLPAALELAAGELSHKPSRAFLQEVYRAMEHGHLASEALRHTKTRYAPVFLEFVLAGEQNDTMKEALAQAAIYFQQQNKTKQMLFSALCYPAVLLILLLCWNVRQMVFPCRLRKRKFTILPAQIRKPKNISMI